MERPESLGAVLRVYYADRDSVLYPDGILRLISVMSCIVCSALQLGGGRCGGGTLAAGGAGTALGGAFALTALSALATCGLPLRAPLAWLCFELVTCTCVGGALLVSALLMFSLCDATHRLDYLHGPFTLVSAALALLSGACVYRAVGGRWERAQDAADAVAPPTEHDV